jgi:ABC-type proline/glycine betaine transport system ATPase subunit
MENKQTGEVSGIYTYDFKDGDYVGIMQDGTIVKMGTKQTAVEWLIEHIKFDAMYEAKTIDEWVNVFQRAKAMEKEQIKESFKHGEIPKLFINSNAEQYYEETYGTRQSNN